MISFFLFILLIHTLQIRIKAGFKYLNFKSETSFPFDRPESSGDTLVPSSGATFEPSSNWFEPVSAICGLGLNAMKQVISHIENVYVFDIKYICNIMVLS